MGISLPTQIKSPSMREVSHCLVGSAPGSPTGNTHNEAAPSCFHVARLHEVWKHSKRRPVGRGRCGQFPGSPVHSITRLRKSSVLVLCSSVWVFEHTNELASISIWFFLSLRLHSFLAEQHFSLTGLQLPEGLLDPVY